MTKTANRGTEAFSTGVIVVADHVALPWFTSCYRRRDVKGDQMINRPYFIVFVLLLAASASAQPLSASDTSVLVERERDLTRALARGQRATVNGFVAEDFSCRVMAEKPFTLRAPSARFSLCTALGNDLSRRADRMAAVEKAENAIPRVATIERIRVEPTDDTTAVVISTQTYVNWFPYDGSFQRRAEVRDTWTLQRGRWLLKERITTPLDERREASK
jgi:hypothetical protein